MNESGDMTTTAVLLRLLVALVIGSLLGYAHQSGRPLRSIVGLALVTASSTGFMVLAKHRALVDVTALNRALQTGMLVIALLSGGVILTRGVAAQRLKTAAAVWVAGAVGLALATGIWWLGAITGITAATVLMVTSFAHN